LTNEQLIILANAGQRSIKEAESDLPAGATATFCGLCVRPVDSEDGYEEREGEATPDMAAPAPAVPGAPGAAE